MKNVKTMIRKNEVASMRDNVITNLGFENEKTIAFCELVEKYLEDFNKYLYFQIYTIYKEIM